MLTFHITWASECWYPTTSLRYHRAGQVHLLIAKCFSSSVKSSRHADVPACTISKKRNVGKVLEPTLRSLLAQWQRVGYEANRVRGRKPWRLMFISCFPTVREQQSISSSGGSSSTTSGNTSRLSSPIDRSFGHRSFVSVKKHHNISSLRSHDTSTLCLAEVRRRRQVKGISSSL